MTEKLVFHLAPRYFTKNTTSNGMKRETCIKILLASFGTGSRANGTSSWATLMNRYPDGFQIVCRPDQFARFIVLRYEAGECINGIKDLSPKLVVDRRLSLYDKIAKQFEGRVTKACVFDVLAAADVDNRYVSFMEDEPSFWVDVSQQSLAATGDQNQEAPSRGTGRG